MPQLSVRERTNENDWQGSTSFGDARGFCFRSRPGGPSGLEGNQFDGDLEGYDREILNAKA